LVKGLQDDLVWSMMVKYNTCSFNVTLYISYGTKPFQRIPLKQQQSRDFE